MTLLHRHPGDIEQAGVMSDILPAKVKVERPDEAEIRELAAKMVEANKAKVLAAASAAANAGARPPGSALAATGNGQLGILNFLTRKGPAGAAVVQPAAGANQDADKKVPAPDEASWKGHFGWDKLGDCHIPYIFRSGEKYCAVRMVEIKLLNKYLNYLHQDIYSCTCIRSYYITEVESRLLNDINNKHCDCQFGRELFTQKDLVVRLSDANEFYNFLDVCYNKLMQEKTNHKDKCGFIRINRESVVPYTVKDGQRFVPLFYFEGETDNLKLKADQLEGWDLSYLKFCCKVQGIRNELFASETCSVISLNDIKSYFPPGTEFEDYWPGNLMESQLLLTAKGSLGGSAGGQWTRAPPAPPPGSGAGTGATAADYARSRRGPQQKAAGQGGLQQASTQQQQLAAAQRSLQAAAASHNLSAAVQALSNGWNGIVNGQTAFPQGITQQVFRMAQAHAAAARYGTGRGHSGLSQSQTRHMQFPTNPAALTLAMAQQQAANAQPPPLVRSQANSIPAHQSSSVNSRNSRQQPQLSQSTNGHHASSGSAGSNTNSMSQHHNNLPGSQDQSKRLIAIADVAPSSAHIPYKVQKALVENMMIPCINMKPYVYTELLMTLPDLVSHFFPNQPLQVCRQVLEILGVELYKGNRIQMQILRNAGKCKNSSDNSVALVQIRDVMTYLPQLKYMLNSNVLAAAAATASDEASQAKRVRTS